MSNKGTKNAYNQIIDTEVGNYYINLCKNDNIIILENMVQILVGKNYLKK